MCCNATAMNCSILQCNWIPHAAPREVLIAHLSRQPVVTITLCMWAVLENVNKLQIIQTSILQNQLFLYCKIITPWLPYGLSDCTIPFHILLSMTHHEWCFLWDELQQCSPPFLFTFYSPWPTTIVHHHVFCGILKDRSFILSFLYRASQTQYARRSMPGHPRPKINQFIH